MTLVAVFSYLIGNTDWSVWGRHNIAIFSAKAEPHTLFAGLPYDFDYSGAVGAPYAIPPQTLPIHSVREGLYRGYCQPDSILFKVFARFRAAEDSIYAAVRAVPDLSEKDVRGLLDYFDDFYRAIDNRAVVQRDFHARLPDAAAMSEGVRWGGGSARPGDAGQLLDQSSRRPFMSRRYSRATPRRLLRHTPEGGVAAARRPLPACRFHPPTARTYHRMAPRRHSAGGSRIDAPCPARSSTLRDSLLDRMGCVTPVAHHRHAVCARAPV